MMLLVGLAPLALLLLYAIWLSARHPHVRRIAVRELTLNKPSTLLTIAGLSVSTALVTPLLSLITAYSGNERDYELRHFDNIAYEVPAIEQTVFPRHYYEAEDMRQMQATASGGESSLLPIVSYEISLSAGGEEEQRVVPNVLVIGVDMAEALRWYPGLGELNWPTELADDRVMLSESAAKRLNAKAGDVVRVLDLNNREIPLYVDRVVKEQGLTGYLGVQRADVTAIVSVSKARELFGLPEGSYTSAVGAGFPAPPWHTVFVKQAGVQAWMDDDPRGYTLFFLGVPILNALLMSFVLAINLFRMMVEERKAGMRAMRTIGFSRLDLKRAMRLEALCYAALACAAGGIVGTLLTMWLVRGNPHLFESWSGVDRLLDAGLLLRSALTGCSIGSCIVFVCVWFVSQRALSYSEMGMAVARETSRKASRHQGWISGLLLLLFLFAAALAALPSVREAWFMDGDFMLLSLSILALLIPVLGYAGSRWMEWGCKAAFRLVGRTPGVYAMLNLSLNQLRANRVRASLLFILFCSVSCLASFSTVLSSFNGQVLKQTEPRAATGGYDYYAEHILPVTSEQLRGYLEKASYPASEFPAYASVIVLPWEESDWRGYTINGVDAAYAESIQLTVTTGDAVDDPWQMLLEDPDGMIVSEDVLLFLNRDRQSMTGAVEAEFASFEVNGKPVRKRIIGVVKDGRSYYPAQSGVWMNAQEALRLGEGVKTLHSALFLRFDTIESAREWRTATANALAEFNIAPLVSVEDSEVGFFRNIGTLLGLFDRFNLFALGIGITGMAVVMLRAAKLRRRELGVLRSIGIPPRMLLVYLWMEGVLTGAFSSGIGFLAGGYYAYALCEPQFRNPSDFTVSTFELPLGQLSALLGLILFAVTAVTYVTARSVYRVSPVESTKHFVS